MDNDQHKFRFIPEVGRGCGFCNSEAECQAGVGPCEGEDTTGGSQPQADS